MSFYAPTEEEILHANSPIVIGWGNEEVVNSITQLDFTIQVWKGSNISKTVIDTFTIDRGNDISAENLIVDLAPYIQGYLGTGLVDQNTNTIIPSADSGVIGIDIYYTVVGDWEVGGATTTSDNNISDPYTIYASNGHSRFVDGVNYIEDSLFLHTPRCIVLAENTQYLLPFRGGNRTFKFTVNEGTTILGFANLNTSEGEIMYLPIGKPSLQKFYFDSDDYTASGGGSVIATTTNGSTVYELNKTSAFGKMDYTLSGITGVSTFSVLAKEGDLDESVIRLTVSGTSYTFRFDLTLIEVTLTNAGFDASIVDAGDGYRLITIEYTGTTTEISLRSDTAQPTGSILYKDPYLDYGLASSKSVKVEIVGSEFFETLEEIEIVFEDCYYEESKQLVYMNRYGAWDCIAILGRTTESSNYTREKYKSNISTRNHNSISYNTKQHTDRVFNISGRKTYTVNTGWTKEDNVEALYDISMSPAVYLVDNLTDIGSSTTFFPMNADHIPVTVLDTSLTKQTNKHDKMINYTITLEEANEYNNRIF